MKKVFFYTGVLFLIVGLFIIINQKIGLTGKVIFQSNNTPIYPISILISFVGLALMAIGNLETKIEKYDGVIVMCRNWRGYPLKRKIVRGKMDLSVASKMCCKVAAEMYMVGEAKKIIVGSGQVEYKNFPSEGQAMKDYLLRKYPVIRAGDILTQEKSLETYEEIDEDLKLAKQNDLDKLALVTVKTQLPRCKQYLESKGKDVECISAEEELSKLSRHYKKVAKGYENSGVAKYELLKESALKALQKSGLTKNKRFIMFLSKVTGRKRK